MLKYMKVISRAVKQPSQFKNSFQQFPGAEAYGKIPAHESSGSRNPCSHSFTGELKITADHSIFVTSVHCLSSSLFYSSKV